MPKTLTVNGTPYSLPLPGEAGFNQPLNDGIYALMTSLGQTDGSVALAGWRQKATAAIATSGWGRFANQGSLAWRSADNKADLRLTPDATIAAMLSDVGTGGLGTEPVAGRPYLQLSTTQQSFAAGLQNITWTTEVSLPAGLFTGGNLLTMTFPGLWLCTFAFSVDISIVGTAFVLALTETHNHAGGLAEIFATTVNSRDNVPPPITRHPFVVSWPIYVSPDETSATLLVQENGNAGAVNVLSGVAAENTLSVAYLGL